MTDKLRHTIFNYLNKNYSGLVRVETYRQPDYTFFMKNDEVIFEYNKKNKSVYISYDKIWSFLESFFGLEYGETQSLTKEWVERQFKSDVTTTDYVGFVDADEVERQFKSDVTTTAKDSLFFVGWRKDNSNQM